MPPERPPMTPDEAALRVSQLAGEIGKLVIAHCDSLSPRDAMTVSVSAAARAWAFALIWYLRQETGKMASIEHVLATWMNSPGPMTRSILAARDDVVSAENQAQESAKRASDLPP